MPLRFGLIHSPLVGPDTWEPVAAELRRLGHRVAVPRLADESADGPHWQRHADSAAAAFASNGERPVLVGHSGAGALLPAIGARLLAPPAAYLFVDAGIHVDGRSRLDMLAVEEPAFADAFAVHLREGGRFPAWTDAGLAGLVPDAGRRSRLLAALRPRALDFFSEPIHVPPGWPDAPVGYLWWSDHYSVPAGAAERRGWHLIHQPAGHFHMLVDPATVAATLVELAGRSLGGA